MAESPSNGTREKRPITDILNDLQKPIPKRLLEEKPATGKKNAPMLKYCPWHRVQKILNHYTGGFCSYEVRDKMITTHHMMVTVRITIYAKDGIFYRDGMGIESLKVDSYGNPLHNAESQAFRRAAARFSLGLHLYEKDD